MLIKIDKDRDINYMLRTCFGFQRSFFKIMKEKGYQVVHEDKFKEIENKLTKNKFPELKIDEAKMLAGLVDATNMTLLDTEPPYNKKEMKFFKTSENFIKYYNNWVKNNAKKI
tara:strand:- start:29076 stop:29414 length:339 start_codon:yes stop_codon:yes gene_type:complete